MKKADYAKHIAKMYVKSLHVSEFFELQLMPTLASRLVRHFSVDLLRFWWNIINTPQYSSYTDMMAKIKLECRYLLAKELNHMGI